MRKSILLAIPILGLTLMLQISVISRIILLHGSADLVLLVLAAWGLQERARAAWFWGLASGLLVGLVSGAPWYIYLVGYMAVIGLARLLARQIWQAPLLAMFAVTLGGTVIIQLLTYLERTILEVPINFNTAFGQVILPSLLLNLLLAILVHSLVRSLALRVYPSEEMA